MHAALKWVVQLALFAVLWVVVCGAITSATQLRSLDIPPGATVAIVGNGPSVVTHDWGPLIDRHDVVVRFNAAKLIPRHTGTKTTIHVVTAGSNRSFEPSAVKILVYNSPLHRLRPLPCRKCLLLSPAEATGVSHPRPTSGLITLAYLSAKFPSNHMYVIGFDGLTQGADFDRTHYFAAADASRTAFDKVFTGVGQAYHTNEAPIFEALLRDRPNLHRLSAPAS